MKKLFLAALVRPSAFPLVIALLLSAAIPSLATDPATGIFAGAELMPADSDVYFAIRADDAYLATLDGLLAKVEGFGRSLGVPDADVPDIRTALAESAADTTQADISAILDWAGDTVALAMQMPADGSEPTAMLAVPLDDRAAAEAYITENASEELIAEEPLGRFTVYRTVSGASDLRVLFSDDVLFIAQAPAETISALASGDYPRLSNEAAFTAAVSALPADSYDVAVYMSESLMASGLAESGLSTSAAVAFGSAILDGSTLAFDVAIPSDDDTATRPLSVNPAFARFIPADAGMVIHGADLANLINSLADMSEAMGGAPVRDQLRMAFGMAGTTLDDFLRWTKGDYALFARIDLAPLLPDVLRLDPDFSGFADAFDFGVVIEATDPARAQDFAQGIVSVLRAGFGSAPDVAFSEETIPSVTSFNGTAVAVWTATDALSSTGTTEFKFALGASDDVFAFGTYNAVQTIFSGGPGLDTAALAADTARYLLPNPTSVWLFDGSMIANIGVVQYLLLAPAVGNVFSDITSQLAATPQPTPTPQYIGPDAATVSALLSQVEAFIPHMTVSTAVSERGAAQIRLTLTLGE